MSPGIKPLRQISGDGERSGTDWSGFNVCLCVWAVGHDNKDLFVVVKTLHCSLQAPRLCCGVKVPRLCDHFIRWIDTGLTLLIGFHLGVDRHVSEDYALRKSNTSYRIRYLLRYFFKTKVKNSPVILTLLLLILIDIKKKLFELRSTANPYLPKTVYPI